MATRQHVLTSSASNSAVVWIYSVYLECQGLRKTTDHVYLANNSYNTNQRLIKKQKLEMKQADWLILSWDIRWKKAVKSYTSDKTNTAGNNTLHPPLLNLTSVSTGPYIRGVCGERLDSAVCQSGPRQHKWKTTTSELFLGRISTEQQQNQQRFLARCKTSEQEIQLLLSKI